MARSKQKRSNVEKSETKIRSKKAKSQGTLADQADKFVCYQKSVQAPDHEVEFFEQAYRDFNRRKPYLLREDFCGTFAICCRWVKSDARRKALAVDLCAETLQWGREHNLSKLNDDQQKRVRVIEQDVRKKNRPLVDVLAAQNFSFWIFKTRADVIEYFRVAYANLKQGGIMVMDMMGGGDCFLEGHVDKRTIKKGKKGFKYLWEQKSFNPVNHDAQFTISFEFKDGSKLKNAFVYDWRFWSIPEVREMLSEAGFAESQCYFEVESEDGEDTDQWERMESSESHAVWLAYIVAVK
jgi:hypothetical protein